MVTTPILDGHQHLRKIHQTNLIDLTVFAPSYRLITASGSFFFLIVIPLLFSELDQMRSPNLQNTYPPFPLHLVLGIDIKPHPAMGIRCLRHNGAIS